MPVVTLADLTKDNWKTVAGLKVAAGQEHFVADNLTSIAESQFYPWTFRKVILADGVPAGFVVYGMNSGETQMWLHRFMIAADFQRRGIGREALRQLIELWRAMSNVDSVKLSYEPENAVAESLYVRAGFVPGEMADWGERIATLTFTDR